MSDTAIAEKEATLPITGMTCANCAATVERTLRKTAGVSDASVNFASERATVHFDPGAVSVEDLAHAVERAGYGVVLAEEGELEDAEARARAEEIRDQTRKFWTGVAFAGPLFALSMARDFGLIGAWAHAPWVNWLMFALATPVQLYVGSDYYVGGWKSLRNGVGEHGRARRARLVGGLRVLDRGCGRPDPREHGGGRARLLRDGRAHHHAHQARQAPRGPGQGRDGRGDP